MSRRIVVVGSSNTDMVIKTDRIPSPGETTLGGTFFMNPGGKGANQAVAAARAGGEVTFICKVGDDIFGRQSLEGFIQAGIDTTCISIETQTPSGVALITVDRDGENSIAVASGANARLSLDDVNNAADFLAGASVILTQLETPMPVIERLGELAKKNGNTFILNPAPAAKLANTLFPHISIITPNRHEAAMLTGREVNTVADAREAARTLLAKGVKSVIVTLGADGCVVVNKSIDQHVPAIKVNATDTTAAGDVFNGALAVSLAEGSDLLAAVAFASAAAAISVTRLGAQASAPYRNEIDKNRIR